GVAHHLAGLRLEVALLVIPARPPAQAAADVEILTQDVAHHVFRGHALRRALVVGTAGGVDVVIAAVPAPGPREHPALQLEALGVRRRGGHGDLAALDEVLRAARPGD